MALCGLEFSLKEKCKRRRKQKNGYSKSVKIIVFTLHLVDKLKGMPCIISSTFVFVCKTVDIILNTLRNASAFEQTLKTNFRSVYPFVIFVD